MFYYHNYSGNKVLCVEANWLFEAEQLFSYEYYKKLVARKQLAVARKGGNGRAALVVYGSLAERYRQQIEKKHGKPEAIAAQNTLEALVQLDVDAQRFYAAYTKVNGKALTEKAQLKYTANASILRACNLVVNNANARSKVAGGRGSLWQKIATAVAELPRHTWPHKLPKNPRLLRQKMQAFLPDNYEELINKNEGHSKTAKLSEASQRWLFARWADRVKKVAGLEQLLREYNQQAQKQSWPKLKSSRTIRNYLYKPEVQNLWYGHRHGELKAKELTGYQHKTQLPGVRDALWYADGTKLNYYYLSENGKREAVQVYEVMDAYSEVLLGYHISKTENHEAQFNAFKMAVQASGSRPFEVKFDGQGGHAKLKSGNFLTAIAHLAVRTKPYNGKSKTIESAFGRFQQQHLKQDWFFTGQNITAKAIESQQNAEHILANNKELPTLAEVQQVYAKRRAEWNNAPHPATGRPRIAMYKDSENEQAQPLTELEYIKLFWLQRPEAVTCRASGIAFTEQRKKREYVVMGADNLPDVQWLTANVGRKFTIKYDPENREIIHLYTMQGDDLVYETVATEKPVIHRAVQEQDDFDRAFITAMQQKVDAERKRIRDAANEVLAEFGATNEQQGLNEPALKGIENRRKTAAKNQKTDAAETFGNYTKDLSNQDQLEELESSLFNRL